MILKLFIVILALIWAGAAIAYGVNQVFTKIKAKKREEYEKRHAAWLKAEEEEEKRKEARRQLLNSIPKPVKGRQKI